MIDASADALRLVFLLVGIMQLLFFAQMIPHLKLALLSSAYGGYGDDRRVTRTIQSPPVLVVSSILWVASCLLLIGDKWLLAAAVSQLLIAQYAFIRVRWSSLSRGCGAPGFCSYWLSLASAVLALGQALSAPALGWFALAVTVDFALIFLCAGIYKLASGYASGNGVLIGLANPQWGYASGFWQRSSLRPRLFKLLDTYGWLGEVLGAVLILIPPTRFLGAVVIASMFVALIPLVRLGTLTLVVITQCVVVILLSGDPLSVAAKSLVGINAAGPEYSLIGAPAWVIALTSGALLVTVFGYTTLLVNFFGKKALPGSLQRLGERVSNALGLILWRVFTADVTDFYVCISAESRGERVLISDWTGIGFGRYQDVTEAITVTSLFTTRRYFPSDPERFRNRLLRYTNTLPRAGFERYSFEIHHISLDKAGVQVRAVATFTVDPVRHEVIETRLVNPDPTSVPSSHTRVRGGIRPGSYLPGPSEN
jgi:hypothetical protein